MKNYEEQNINLDDLLIDIENPRFDIVSDENEAMRSMIANKGENNIYQLAKDILNRGLNPSERLIVIPHPQYENKYQVQEGNRRTTALKILKNPTLISTENPKLYQKMIKLREENSENYNNLEDSIPCIIFESQEFSMPWIELKHTGANNGIGVISWDSIQKERFNQKIKGKSSIALQIIDYLINSDLVEEKVKSNAKTVPITNLARLLSDSNVLDFLGIKIEKNSFEFIINDSEVLKGLSKIIIDLNSKFVRVKQIYTKEDRLNYLKNFDETCIPDKTQIKPQYLGRDRPPTLFTPVTTAVTPPVTTAVTPPVTTAVTPPVTTAVIPPVTTEVVPPATTEVVPPATTEVVPPATTEVVPPATTELIPPATTELIPPARTEITPPARTEITPLATTEITPLATTPTITYTSSFPSTMDRNTLIPKDFNILIHERRINNIFIELKLMDISKYENAISVLLRVFLELTLDSFITHKSITTVHENSNLRTKLEKVAEHLEDNGILTKQELSPIRVAYSQANSITAINTFNQYVHNLNHFPAGRDLKTSWDNYQFFIQKIWENII